MKLYLNGILYEKERATKPNSANNGKFTKLVLGASDELIPFVSESYEIHIDDFAIWFSNLSNGEIAYVMEQGKATIDLFSLSTLVNVLRDSYLARNLINQTSKVRET